MFVLAVVELLNREVADAFVKEPWRHRLFRQA